MMFVHKSRRLHFRRAYATVSARLGTTRVSGKAQPAVFNRQVAMYLAKHVGGWSTTRIGKFYNGRDHLTGAEAGGGSPGGRPRNRRTADQLDGRDSIRSSSGSNRPQSHGNQPHRSPVREQIGGRASGRFGGSNCRAPANRRTLVAAMRLSNRRMWVGVGWVILVPRCPAHNHEAFGCSGILDLLIEI